MQHLQKPYYKPAKSKWYRGGRSSETDLYLHEIIQKVTIQELDDAPAVGNHFAIIGYACDKGVSVNNGRTGARKGPKAFRKEFGKRTNHLAEQDSIVDVGNVLFKKKQRLLNTQDALATVVEKVLAKGYFPIVIGGGHDLSFGHYTGIDSYLVNHANQHRIGIINFDAHLDLRKPDPNGHSGTPFYQIAERADSEFAYCAIGIRSESNHQTLFQTADRLNTTIIPLADCKKEKEQKIKFRINQFLESIDRVYLTIDMDGFSSAYSPGVSAPHPIGLSPDFLHPILDFIFDSKKVISVDFAELNPVYDTDSKSASLAASLAWDIVHMHRN